MRFSRPKRQTLFWFAAAVIFRVLSRKRQPHAKLKRKAKTVRAKSISSVVAPVI
jgi:hypothetical protein